MKNNGSLTLVLAVLAAATTGCPRASPTPDAGPRDAPGGDASDGASVDADVAGPADAPDAPQATCGDTRFVRPMADAVMGIADDADHDCANGFTSSVQVSTNAPTGTTLVLEFDGRRVGAAAVAGSSVTFQGG